MENETVVFDVHERPARVVLVSLHEQSARVVLVGLHEQPTKVDDLEEKRWRVVAVHQIVDRCSRHEDIEQPF